MKTNQRRSFIDDKRYHQTRQITILSTWNSHSNHRASHLSAKCHMSARSRACEHVQSRRGLMLGTEPFVTKRVNLSSLVSQFLPKGPYSSGHTVGHVQTCRISWRFSKTVGALLQVLRYYSIMQQQQQKIICSSFVIIAKQQQRNDKTSTHTSYATERVVIIGSKMYS